jgi:hypothetical protein
MDTKTMRVDTSQAILITKQDNLLTVRETDWKRLKRLVNTCKISTEWWSIAASVLFGIAGSAALSAITLLNDDASSIKIIIWVIAGASALMGVLCVIAAVDQRNETHNKIEEIQKTLLEIEDQLSKE